MAIRSSKKVSVRLYLQSKNNQKKYGQIAENSPNKCYYFGPGITVPGADYRREHGLPMLECAKLCEMDSCCMAFEWSMDQKHCTLKSRSLNGTITSVDGEVYFGLCLDYGNFVFSSVLFT